MDKQRSVSVSFTGHRSYRDEGRRQLDDVLQMLYKEGYRRFLTGMAWGFDLAAARAVIDLQQSHDDVQLVAVEPFAGFMDLFEDDAAAEYDEVLVTLLSMLFRKLIRWELRLLHVLIQQDGFMIQKESM